MEVSGVEAFLLLLDHFQFFNEIRNLFTDVVSVTHINASTSMSVQSVSSSQSKSSSAANDTEDIERSEMIFYKIYRTLCKLYRKLSS